MPIHFQRLTESDLPMLAEWLQRPHIAAWCGACCSVEEVRANYLPELASPSAVVPYLAYLDSLPIGYIQSLSRDQFLADEHCLGQGLGTQMVREFVQFLFRDPAVTRIQADPAPTNARAIRCYEKEGFRALGLITTPDGPALLMALDRPGLNLPE
jgi:ribosomal protein S18 acetylase RimI-like enzyme